jgi:hypothetical protein
MVIDSDHGAPVARRHRRSRRDTRFVKRCGDLQASRELGAQR